MFDALPSLAETVRQYQLAAKKSLGQNFLLDMNVVRRVAKTAGDLKNFQVIEVGPGPGGLTRALLEREPAHLVVVEKDERFLHNLEALRPYTSTPFTLIHEDALKVSPQALYPEGNIKIVSNLPYNVGTPLLIRWLHKLERISSLTLMFQKEVALRIVAPVNSTHYGRLSVIVQYLCQVERVFDLPPGAFSPPPKVTSSVVFLVPKTSQEIDPSLIAPLEKITHFAFAQRRKMIRSSLRSLFSPQELEDLGISPSLRAENLCVNDFIRLAQTLQSLHI